MDWFSIPQVEQGPGKVFLLFLLSRVLWTGFGTKDGAELHAAKWAMQINGVFILRRIMKSQMVEIPIKQTVSWNLIRKLFFAIYFRSSFDIWGGLVNACQTIEVAFLLSFWLICDHWTNGLPMSFFFLIFYDFHVQNIFEQWKKPWLFRLYRGLYYSVIIVITINHYI